MRPPEPSLSAEILAIGIASILLPSPYTHCRLAPGPIGFGHFPSGWAGFWPFLESSAVAIRTVLESGYRGVGRLIARRHHLAGLFLGVKQTQSARKRTWGLNVCCQGWSGRTGDVAGESVVSHKPKLTPVSPVTNAAGSRPDQKIAGCLYPDRSGFAQPSRSFSMPAASM